METGGVHVQPEIRPDAAVWPVSASEMYLFGGGPSNSCMLNDIWWPATILIIITAELWFFNGTWLLLHTSTDVAKYPTDTSKSTCEGCSPGPRWAMATWVEGGLLWLKGGRLYNRLCKLLSLLCFHSSLSLFILILLQSKVNYNYMIPGSTIRPMRSGTYKT